MVQNSGSTTQIIAEIWARGAPCGSTLCVKLYTCLQTAVYDWV